MEPKRSDLIKEAILKQIKQGYHAAQIAEELKVARNVISYHIKKMINDGLIQSENLGYVHKLTLTPRGGVELLNKLPHHQAPPTKRFHAYGLRYQRLGTLKEQDQGEEEVCD